MARLPPSLCKLKSEAHMWFEVMHQKVCPKIANRNKYPLSYIRTPLPKPPNAAPQLGHHGQRGKNTDVGEQ